MARSRSSAPRSAAPKIRLPRTAKGGKPQYFSDPATDKLLWMTMTLMEELSVARDRIDALERVLARKGVLDADEVEGFRPDPAAAQARAARRASYVDRMLRAAQSELASVTGSDDPHEEAIRAVEGRARR